MSDTWTAISGYATAEYADTMVFKVDHGTKKLEKISGQTLVAGEENSQYIRFEMPRYWDGIDIIGKTIKVVHMLANRYFGETATINGKYSDDMLQFGWVVPKTACCISGTLMFVIVVTGTDYVLKTQIAETPVAKSIDIDGTIPEPSKEAWYREFQARIDSVLQNAEDVAARAAEAAYLARSYVGAPLAANHVADMVDPERIYVYTGSEDGYTAGYWYHYDGSQTPPWVPGGIYNAVAVETDTTLRVAGKAADGKAAGDAVAELKEDLSAKVDIAQGVAHAGEALIIGEDGNVTTGEAGVSVDTTLSVAGKAADAKATGDSLRALSELDPNGKDVAFTIENGTWGNKAIGETITGGTNNNLRRAMVNLTDYIGKNVTLHFEFSAAQGSTGAYSYLCNSSAVVAAKRSEYEFYTNGDWVFVPTADTAYLYFAYTAAKVSSATLKAVSQTAQDIADIPQIKADVADAVKTINLTNLCENGDIDDTTGFSVNSASVVTISASDNVMTITPLARNADVFYSVPTSIVAGHKYYFACDIKTGGNMTNTYVRLQQYKSSIVNLSGVYYDTNNADTWQRLSMAYTSGFESSDGTLRLNLHDATASGWVNIYLRRIVIIDLTATFGAGNEPDTGAIDAIIAKYATDSFFDGQLKTNVITQEVYSADAHKEPIYVGVSGYIMNVNAKYSADKDISYTIGKTGSNSIFNFRYPSFLDNDSLSVSSVVDLSQVIPIETDWLSPEKLKVPSESADGDMPNSDNFTGGNHAYNGDSSGSATAETSAYSFHVDGRKVTEYSGYAHYVDVYWTNLVQATNTKKADGTGRAVMQEDFHAHFDGVKWTIDARFTALEALASWNLYGIACRRGSTWNGYVFYHDSPNNRAWNNGASSSNAGGNTCKCVTIRKNSDYFDMGVESDGLGDMAMSASNSFFSSDDKTYSDLVKSATNIAAGAVYTYKGFYRFYSVA